MAIAAANPAFQLLDLQIHYSFNPRSKFIPVDEDHPLVSVPNFASLTPGEQRTDLQSGRTFQSFLWGDVSTGTVPFGRQPNGIFLYGVAFHNRIFQPSVSSSIPGTVNLQVVPCPYRLC